MELELELGSSSRRLVDEWEQEQEEEEELAAEVEVGLEKEDRLSSSSSPPPPPPSSTLRDRWIAEVGKYLFSHHQAPAQGSVGGVADGFDLWTSMDGLVEEICKRLLAATYLQRKRQ